MSLPTVGLEAVIAKLDSFEAGAKAIQRAYDDINNKAGSVEKATGGLGTSITGLGSKLLNLGAIAGGAALAGVTALGAGLATFAVTGINKAIDLDAQMATIAATMNTTKDAVGPLKDLILDLALDPNLTVNTTQAADAIQLLAQNGATADDIMGGLAKSTVALANATGAQFSVAADVASGVMTVFGLKANEVETAIDGITGVTNQSKFTIDDYAQAFAQAGGIAAGMGVTLEDFNTVIGVTATSFKSGSDAGTSFKTFLQRLANPTAKMKAVMEELGISLFDSNGNMRDMKDVAGQLHTSFENLTEAERAEAAAKLGGADAARTVIALSQISSAEFDKLSGSVNESGQAFRAAATRVDSVKGAFEIFRGIIEAVQIQVGDKFLPLLRSVTVGFTDLASKSAPMVVAFFGRISELISGLIGRVTLLFDVFGEKGLAGVFASLGFGGSALFLKNLGELIVMMGLTGVNATSLGDIITSTLGAAFTWLTTNLFPMLTQGIQFIMVHFEEFKGALIGIGAIAGAGIFAALIAGIVGLVGPITLVIGAAALLGAAWAGNWGGIQEKTFAVWAVVQPVLTQLMTWLQINIPLALQFLSETWTNILWPAIVTVTDFLVSTVFPLFANFVSMYIDVMMTRLQVLSDTWTLYLLPALTTVWKFINTVLMPLWVSLVDLLTAVVGVAVKALAGLWQNVLQPALAVVGDFIMAQLQPAFDAIAKTVSEKVSPVTDNLASKVLPVLSKGLQTVIKWIKDATGFFNSLAKAVKSFTLPPMLRPGSPPPFAVALQDIARSANMAAGGVANLVSSLGGPQFKSAFDKLFGINRGIKNPAGLMGAAFDDLEKNLKSSLSKDQAGFALDAMKRAIRANFQSIMGSADPLVALQDVMQHAVGNWEKAGIRNLNAFGAANAFMTSFKKNVALADATLKEMFTDGAKMAIDFAENINSFASSAVDRLNTRVDALGELLKTQQDTYKFEGQILSAVEAQELYNAALAEQLASQEAIAELQQNQADLAFLRQQIELIEQARTAGINVADIFGGVEFGLNASIPDLIAATNAVVQAMIDQMNADLQIASPSKVTGKIGGQAGQGLVEGLLAKIPDFRTAMSNLVGMPSLVNGPALGGGGSSPTSNTYFNMSVNTGAAPSAVIQQYEIMRAMVS